MKTFRCYYTPNFRRESVEGTSIARIFTLYLLHTPQFESVFTFSDWPYTFWPGTNVYSSGIVRLRYTYTSKMKNISNRSVAGSDRSSVRWGPQDKWGKGEGGSVSIEGFSFT